jgi:hypothetical protein
VKRNIPNQYSIRKPIAANKDPDGDKKGEGPINANAEFVRIKVLDEEHEPDI